MHSFAQVAAAPQYSISSKLLGQLRMAHQQVLSQTGPPFSHANEHKAGPYRMAIIK